MAPSSRRWREERRRARLWKRLARKLLWERDASGFAARAFKRDLDAARQATKLTLEYRALEERAEDLSVDNKYWRQVADACMVKVNQTESVLRECAHALSLYIETDGYAHPHTGQEALARAREVLGDVPVE